MESDIERKIKIVWDKRTLNKIWRKHKVEIYEILECIKEKRIINRVGGDKYRIIGKTKDKFLTIFAYRAGGDYEIAKYKLATARCSTEQEKKYYRRET